MAQEKNNEGLEQFGWDNFPGMGNGEGISNDDFAALGGTDPKPLENQGADDDDLEGGNDDQQPPKKEKKKGIPRISNSDFSDDVEGGDDDDDSDEDPNATGDDLEDDQPSDGEGATGLIAIAKFLKEKGVLSSANIADDKEDLTEDELVEMHEQEYENRFNTYAKEFFEGIKEEDQAVALFDHLRKGGSVTDFVSVHGKQVLPQDLDLTKPENQKLVMRRHMLEIEGADVSEIDAELDAMEEAGLLESKSKRAFKKLNEIDQKEKDALTQSLKDKETQNRQNAQKFADNINTLLTTATTLKSIPVTPKEKGELKDYMTKPAVIKGTSKVPQFNADLATALKDPEAVAAIAHLLKNNFNVTTKAKTAVAREVKSSLSGVKIGGTKTKTKTGGFVNSFPGIAK